MLLRNLSLVVASVAVASVAVGCTTAERPLRLSSEYGKVVRHVRQEQTAYPEPTHVSPEAGGVVAKNVVEAYQKSFEAKQEKAVTPLITIK